MTDELELLAGTDPLNWQDFLHFERISIENGRCTLQFTGHAGRTYTIEKRAEFSQTSAWVVLREQIAQMDGPQSVSDPLTTRTCYYRLRAVPSP